MNVRVTLTETPHRTDLYSVKRVRVRDGHVWLQADGAPPYHLEALKDICGLEIDQDGADP